MVKIYNTLSKKKAEIKPLKPKKVNMFVCGPTVYDFPHIGHARTYIIFDCFVKYLKSVGFKVFYLQNITDIDDKIIARAREKGVPVKDLAEAFYQEHLKEMKAISVNSVNKYAKATDYIPEILSQVQRLLDEGYAYQLDDGIYYNIKKFKNYGKLSGRTALQAEDSVSRIDYSTHKKNRGDFCLWKFTFHQTENTMTGFSEPSWPCRFGDGRPGWHIEDTAITEKFFGSQYDIHGSAIDLLFPHHEAEIAQMEAISGKSPLAKYWMHIGFLTINGQKMSKSLNNSLLISAFLKRYSYHELRFWVAKNLWSSPIDYSDSTMIEVKNSLEKIEEFLRKLKSQKSLKSVKAVKSLFKIVKEDFVDHLKDNFNTPLAFGTIFDFIKKMNPLLEDDLVSKKDASEIYTFFQSINKIFDFIDFKKLGQSNIPDEVKKLVKERETSRKTEDWQKSDEIRIEIEKYGFTVQDSKNGPVIKKL